jgi:hypothetical protein
MDARLKAGHDEEPGPDAVTTYSVYEASNPPANLAERAERLAFVKEGFSWPAFFVPFFWLIYHRMWIELVLLTVLLVALQFAFGLDQRGEALVGWVSLAVSILFAFEANDLRTAALERRGYKLAGVTSGDSRDDAELSFLRAWLPQQERASALPEPAPRRADKVDAPRARSGEGEEVIGLFPRA